MPVESIYERISVSGSYKPIISCSDDRGLKIWKTCFVCLHNCYESIWSANFVTQIDLLDASSEHLNTSCLRESINLFCCGGVFGGKICLCTSNKTPSRVWCYFCSWFLIFLGLGSCREKKGVCSEGSLFLYIHITPSISIRLKFQLKKLLQVLFYLFYFCKPILFGIHSWPSLTINNIWLQGRGEGVEETERWEELMDCEERYLEHG